MCVIRISTYNAIIMKVKWITEYKVLRKTPGIKKLISVIIRIFLIMNYCILSRDHTLSIQSPPYKRSFETALSLHAGPQPPPLQIWFLWCYSFSLAGNSSHIPRLGKPSICHRKFLYIYIKVTVENIQPLILWVPRTSVYTWQIFWNFLWL